MSWLASLERRAALRQRAGLARSLHHRDPGDAAIDLAGNDYLGLSHHPAVLASASAALDSYGLGATASRLVTGSTQAHAALERDLADFLGTEAALVYSSGYLANLGAVRALANPHTLVVLDAHAHASLIDAVTVTGASAVTVAHADPGAVAAALAQEPGRRALVVTESVFSVDGDRAPLGELYEVCREAGAILLVDEAHAVGVLGSAGAGALAESGLAGAPGVVVTATLSKALGASGGIVAGPTSLIHHLVDTSRTFIYDTALPPPVAAGARAALGCVRSADELRDIVRTRAHEAAVTLRAAGHEVREPAAGIVSVTAPGPKAAVAWAGACREAGVVVGCFRPPTTPDQVSRLRLTFNASVPAADFSAALAVIVKTAP